MRLKLREILIFVCLLAFGTLHYTVQAQTYKYLYNPITGRLDMVNTVVTPDTIWEENAGKVYLHDSTNSVGIGTSTPDEVFHVAGNSKLEDTTTVNELITDGIAVNMSGPSIIAHVEVGGGDGSLAITSSSSIQLAYLSMRNDAGRELRHRLYGSARTGTIMGQAIGNNAFFDVTASALNIGTIGNYDLNFGTNNVFCMTVENDGDVGIGVQNPACKLEVDGDGKFSGKLGIGINPTVGINVYSSGTYTPQLRFHDGDISNVFDYDQFTPNSSINTTGIFETTDDTYGGLSISGLLADNAGSAGKIAVLISGIASPKNETITVAPIVFRAIEGINASVIQALPNSEPCLTIRNYTTDLTTFYPEKTHILNTFLENGGTITQSDATPDVSGANVWIYAGGADVTITDLDNPIVGAIYVLIGVTDEGGLLSITDGGNFHLSGNAAIGEDDSIILYCKADNDYIELSRSNN